jgi:hypothetical protein
MMSFEMKYDKEGRPVPSAELQQSLEQQPEETSQEQSVDEVESVEAVQEQQPQQRSTPQESFKELRTKAEHAQREAEKAKQERDEMMRRLIEVESGRYKEPQKQEVPEDDDINLGPDDLAEGKHLSKVGRKLKKLEDQVKYYQQQTQTTLVENRLKSQYPDFDNVVSSETLPS